RSAALGLPQKSSDHVVCWTFLRRKTTRADGSRVHPPARSLPHVTRRQGPPSDPAPPSHCVALASSFGERGVVFRLHGLLLLRARRFSAAAGTRSRTCIDRQTTSKAAWATARWSSRRCRSYA